MQLDRMAQLRIPKGLMEINNLSMCVDGVVVNMHVRIDCWSMV